MPDPERIAEAHLFLRKAEQDLEALEVLHERGGIAAAVLGFHAQQAVEKALKAVLIAHGWPGRRTHDLKFLLDDSAQHGIDVPADVAAARWLTPWAVELRYDDFLDDELDRNAAAAGARAAVVWAAERLR